jgi:hypothetical protein
MRTHDREPSVSAMFAAGEPEAFEEEVLDSPS